MPDDSSRSGLYAVVSVRTGTILRVTLFRALAHEWRDPSRDIYECYADAVDNASLIARSTTSPRSSARQSRESNDLDLKPGVVFITLPVMDTQYCPRCQETKPLTEFHWQKKGVRRQRYCKPCQRERMHAQYQKGSCQVGGSLKRTRQEDPTRVQGVGDRLEGPALYGLRGSVSSLGHGFGSSRPHYKSR
jgi:hypothetical protein